MRRTLATVGLIVTAAVLPAAGQEKADMNITRIALFSSGVGYFEREAEVAGNATAELAFRTDQINDILKSLVLQDLGGGTVGTVSYASRDPIEKTLKSFGVDITGKPTLGDLLDQLRGEPVEIAAPRALRGVILGVEKKQIIVEGNRVVEQDVLNVLTEAGMEQLPIAELRGIKLVSEKVAGELRKALEALATAHDADKKSVVLRFAGPGQRRVRAAYLLEAPIWKTSYRLLLADDQKPFLQGWATVDNATEDDWKDVQLSLISGRPISFRMDLYTPIYVPRPIEQLELYASLRPPEYEGGFGVDFSRTTEGDKQAENAEDRAKALMLRAPAAPTAGRARRGAGAPAEPEMAAREALALGDAGVASVAAAQEAGELFEYVIRTPVSIPRQHSAMLPIVNQAVEGTKVSIYNPATHAKYPLNGLELTNATDLNLMQGPVTIFDDDVYAGDAKLPDLKPGEKRLVGYALDLAAEVMIKQQPRPDELVSLRIGKGLLWHRHRYVDEREYLVKNKAARAKTVILEQPYTQDWKLLEPKEAYETTPALLRFKTEVPAGQTKSYKTVLERVADQSLVLMSSGLDEIRFFLRTRVVSPAVKEALEKVVALRTELDQLVRQREALEKRVAETVQEQARVRENLKTLQQNTDPYQRQLKKFDELETQIGELRQQIEQARRQEEQQRQGLEQYLLSLNIE